MWGNIFIQNGCAAIAVGTQWFVESMKCQEITQTSKVYIAIVNYERVAEYALGIAELVKKI